MIILGLIFFVSFIVLNLTKQTTQTSTKYQFDTEITLITNEINGILSDPNKCLTTFTNATQAAAPSLPILNSTPANVLAPTGIAGIPSTNRKYLITGGPYGNGGVKISSYSLNLTASTDAILTINFQKKSTLGTGTTPRTIRLYVEKNGTGVITLCRSIASANADIWSRGTGSSIFYNGGNVGIGSSSPAYILDVAGNARLYSTVNNTALFLTRTDNVNTVKIDSNGSSYLNGGNLGIGTQTPQAKLDVAGEAKIGNTGLACNATSAGAMRYNAAAMEYCNGTSWTIIGGGGIKVDVYKCPGTCAGCNGGAWGYYGCQGQYTSQTTCSVIEFPCNVTCNCPYVGKMTLSP